MMSANITRLMTFAQHGQPKAYAASDMMRADLEAVLLELAEARAKLDEAPIGCNRTGGPPGCSTTCGANPDCLILKSSRANGDKLAAEFVRACEGPRTSTVPKGGAYRYKLRGAGGTLLSETNPAKGDKDEHGIYANGVYDVEPLVLAAGAPSVVVTFGPDAPEGPCAVCGKTIEQHGTYPTCATHPFTDDDKCKYLLGAKCSGAQCMNGCVQGAGHE